MVDPNAFRGALASFATGVAVVTCRDATGAPVGVTVSPFTSVSLQPPLVLFCLDRQSIAHPAFARATHWAVSVLGEGMQEVSHGFAFSPDPWIGTAWRDCEFGVPLLENAIAHLLCQAERGMEGGDHTILLGRVLRADAHAGAPLLYFRSRYGALVQKMEA